MKFSFHHLIRFRVDYTRVFQRVSVNLNTTVGKAKCQLLCRHIQSTLAASWVELNRVDFSCELGDLIKA